MEDDNDEEQAADGEDEEDEDFNAVLERELAGDDNTAAAKNLSAGERGQQPTAEGATQATGVQSGADSEEMALLKEARQKQAVLAQMTEEQLDRYEAFRRSSLQKKSMKRSVTGLNPNAASSNNSTIILCGIAKMFVAELVEEAKMIASDQKQTGPLQPSHIHAAYQRLDAEGKIPHCTGKKRKCRY